MASIDDGDDVILIDDDVVVEHSTLRNVSKRPLQDHASAPKPAQDSDIIDLIDLIDDDLTATTTTKQKSTAKAPAPDFEIVAVKEQPVPKKRKTEPQHDAQLYPWKNDATQTLPPPPPQYQPLQPRYQPLPPQYQPPPAAQAKKKDTKTTKQQNTTNQSGPAYAKLQKELKQWHNDPLPLLRALPSPNNLLEWHYVLEGNPDSPYANGFYHGIVTFPPDYPWKPPSIKMLTPSGRFETNRRICLTISDYHPESWNPQLSSKNIVLGVQSFFHEDTPTAGAVYPAATTAQKKEYAKNSLAYNVKNKMFATLFPELVELHEQKKKGGSLLSAIGGFLGGGNKKN